MEISDILKRYPAAKLEFEVNALIHALTEDKDKLTEILTRYGVTRSDEIKEKIERKEIAGHPAFEDYLSAIAYEMDYADLLKRLEEILSELKVQS